jgi:nicotinate-nucleotide adenylyltransferase
LRLAIFGGTFDPIHSAHLTIAKAAANRFHLDRVLFVPAASPPHKHGVTHAGFEDRVRMAEIACAADRRFEVSRLEEGTERSYSIETIEKVRAKLAPGDELFFLIGADAFAEIETWHRWRDVVAAVRFLIVSRPGSAYRLPEGAACEVIDTLELAVSSSEIRRALAAGETPAGVPAEVMAYIRAHHLYNSAS